MPVERGRTQRSCWRAVQSCNNERGRLHLHRCWKCAMSGGCCDVSVAVLATPDAGSPGNISLCSSDAAINLFAQLGGTPDAGGTWTGPSAVVGGQFDPASMTAGVYTYTINVPPPCVNVSSTVTCRASAAVCGNDGALTLCISSPASGLFAALGGSPDAGGTWAGPSAVVGGPSIRRQ
jgi:hypothetical protein